MNIQKSIVIPYPNRKLIKGIIQKEKPKQESINNSNKNFGNL